MSCELCRKAKPVLTCIDDLIVGTFPDYPSQELWLYLKTASTGRLQRLRGETDAEGVLTVDISAFQAFVNTDYEAWVTEDGIDDRLTIQISETEQDCLILNFERVFYNSSVVNSQEQTLELA